MGETVKKLFCALAIFAACGLSMRAQTSTPLKLIQTIEMPDVPVGPYTDHLAVDLKGHRLFVTPQAHKSVYVLDLETGKLIHDIGRMGNPHSVLYRSDLDRIYVTDGGAGQLKVFSGKDYRLIKAVKLLPDADSIGYDAATKYLYVTNGGEGAKLEYSLLSVVDTDKSERVGDVRVPTESLEAMALQSSGTKIYINLTDKNEIDVIDRGRRTLIGRWPVTKGKHNIAVALDEKHHRLFVGCRDTETSGVIVVFDTETGRELQALPIAGWVDYIAFDPETQRIYATCGSRPDGSGGVYVYREKDADQYGLIDNVTSAPKGKTGLFVPELHRFFVPIPHYGDTSAKVLVFEVN
jgi:DNA-binding beta-propeller fold protein YncE